MKIMRYEDEKTLARKFEDDLLKCNAIVPGINSDDFSRKEYSFMNSSKVKTYIEKYFGKTQEFINDEANFFAFNFKNEIIICISEDDQIGSSWYWLKSKEDGSRYGSYVLLPTDKEVEQFWPDFCKSFKEQVLSKHAIKKKFK